MKNTVYLVVIGLLASIIVIGAFSSSPSHDNRVEAIGSRIMCPVCQGSAITNSPSETAVAMLAKVDELVGAGMTDDEILAYFQARYGEYIILDPAFRGKTLLIWLLPVAAFGVGVWMITRRKRKPVPSMEDRL